MTRARWPSAFSRFFADESAGGVLLALAAVLALIVSNSPWHDAYASLLSHPGELRVGGWLVLAKPLVVWVNDLWMAAFFLLVGLEIKREFVGGELASRRRALLPAAAAFGGMFLPALIYAALNRGDAVGLRGWAIPAATDIAFTVGILMLLGPRVPASLKLFVTAVAIIDDLGAIIVIALFYTDQLSAPMLLASAAIVMLLALLNRLGVARADVYVAVGLVLWLCVLKSGVHATLAGVVTAFAVPTRGANGAKPLESLEHGLHPWVAFGVLPMFAFCNAGVSLAGASAAVLLQPVPLGIVLGLVVGKAVGIFGTSELLIAAGIAERPAIASRRQFFGVCVLCGIGFTMSLFIGGLAFQGHGPAYELQLKLGVLLGSLVSALIGSLILLSDRSQRPAPSADR